MTTSQKSVIITGGGQGIGKCMTLRFLEAGYRVAIAEMDEEAGRETAAEYQALGEVMFAHCDVGDETAVREMMEQTVNRFGSVDILINNAGLIPSVPFEELTVEYWERVLRTNLTGAFLCAKYTAQHLRERKGCIINIASTRAYMSEPGSEAYAASKGGLVALTHALAMSLGPDVRVNAIAPGWIVTDDWQKTSKRQALRLTEEDHAQHPCGRVGRPDDVAALALFLASDQSGFITGTCYTIDGGMTRKMIYLE